MKRYGKVKNEEIILIQKNTGLSSTEINSVLYTVADLGYIVVKPNELKPQVKNMEELNALPVGTVIGIERAQSLRVWTKDSDSNNLDDWTAAGNTYLDPDWLPAVILWSKQD